MYALILVTPARKFVLEIEKRRDLEMRDLRPILNQMKESKSLGYVNTCKMRRYIFQNRLKWNTIKQF